MNITTYLYRGLKFQEHGLGDENFPSLETDTTDFCLSKDGLFLVVLVELVNDFVDVKLLVFEHGVEWGWVVGLGALNLYKIDLIDENKIISIVCIYCLDVHILACG